MAGPSGALAAGPLLIWVMRGGVTPRAAAICSHVWPWSRASAMACRHVRYRRAAVEAWLETQADEYRRVSGF